MRLVCVRTVSVERPSFVGDGVGLHAVGEHLQDLALAGAERAVALVEHDRRGQARIDVELAGAGRLDRAHEVLGGGVLAHVALDARLERLAQQPRAAVGGEDHDRRPQVALELVDDLGHVDAGAPGVDDHDVGRDRLDPGGRVLDRRGVGDRAARRTSSRARARMPARTTGWSSTIKQRGDCEAAAMGAQRYLESRASVHQYGGCEVRTPPGGYRRSMAAAVGARTPARRRPSPARPSRPPWPPPAARCRPDPRSRTADAGRRRGGGGRRCGRAPRAAARLCVATLGFAAVFGLRDLGLGGGLRLRADLRLRVPAFGLAASASLPQPSLAFGFAAALAAAGLRRRCVAAGARAPAAAPARAGVGEVAENAAVVCHGRPV